MKKLFLGFAVATLVLIFMMPTFAQQKKRNCMWYGPPFNAYRCMNHGEQNGVQEESAPAKKEPSGCNQLDLTISCAASGKAVDWINTCSLDCGDGNRYDALAVQKDSTTLSCWHREVPPNKSCRVTVGSGFDSKVVGSVQTAGNCKQTLRGVCAW